MPLDRSEFIDYMTLIREDIKELKETVQAQNGRLRAVETSVGILQDRQARTAAGAAAGGTFLGGVIVAVYQYFAGGGK